jgi:pyruvate dehydrogenase E1 component alpha subunit
MGSSSIVGGGISIGVGHALASKLKQEDRVTVVFFGDGAADEGTLYESINFAVLKKLPVIFILENNQWSVCSPVAHRWPGEMIFHKMPPEQLQSARLNGNDVLEVHDHVQSAVARARRGDGPSFIECVTYRLRGHAGSGSDAHLGHRSREEIEAWETRCPVAAFRERLIMEQSLTPEIENEMQPAIEAELEEAFHFAVGGPLPRAEDLTHYLYCE